MTDQEKIDIARNELLQAQTELEEAAKIIHGQGLSSTASIFREAAKRKLSIATALFPPLVGQ